MLVIAKTNWSQWDRLHSFTFLQIETAVWYSSRIGWGRVAILNGAFGFFIVNKRKLKHRLKSDCLRNGEDNSEQEFVLEKKSTINFGKRIFSTFSFCWNFIYKTLRFNFFQCSSRQDYWSNKNMLQTSKKYQMNYGKNKFTFPHITLRKLFG